ncbi:MAG: lysylphosphatidylglycerol synthase transmembrane domain-containing protein [Atopobiaceae bacterium]|jgi:uncharacterized protein (TIRG00374 family)|nr:flippase-like domain-containing protein [Atopobiaceae bacterium]MCH4181490.1 flippase-like domain-containing protein [Atopobiaceae bacterium]MCH4214429.1 flippase-like domain-containing protein [Atopobiaceae bacterium]MCH4229359.1 flippase-like domain-containing protein [Atopobiaceae bacterium]MCH4276683.1 flippase-like domain-containing protein [Atopobiaceae bacterium]
MARSYKQKTQSKVTTKVSSNHAVPTAQAEAEADNYSTVRKSILFLAAVAVAYVCYLVFSGQMGEFLSSIATVDKAWVVAAMLAYVVYYAVGVMAYVMAIISDPHCPLGIRDLMSVEASGIFFSNLTPNGTGGAPAQIYRLTRAGLSMGSAGAVQYTRFIMYEAGEGIFAALMLIFRLDYFLENFGGFVIIGALLFVFKILEVAALLVVCLFPNFIVKLGNWVLRFLSKRGWLKDFDHWNEVVNTQVLEFSDGFKAAASNVGNMVATLLLTLFQLGCLYALPWFVLNAFGKPADLLTCLASGSMLELLTSAIPLPGGTFGAEGGFALLFGPLFAGEGAAGFVVWRMVEYFLPVLAATPLLGLRSDANESLNYRWHRLASRSGSAASRLRRHSARRQSASVDLKRALKGRGRHH